jgi:predicted MPP superfamily phosphohydrolase
LGNLVGNRHLDRLLPLVNDWQPDVVLLAGDVIDDTVEPFLRRDMSSRLARLQAKYGVFAVLGNHEYYGGHIPEYVETMRRIGIPVLQDETVTVGGAIQIAGRKDKTAESMDPQGRKPIAELVSAFDDWLPIIVMDHQPTRYDLAAAAGVDILVSGHTHRGQMAPNHWITRRMFELDWGYLRKKQMHAFVSSGFGTWGPPIRLASRSEIVQITVHFKGGNH